MEAEPLSNPSEEGRPSFALVERAVRSILVDWNTQFGTELELRTGAASSACEFASPPVRVGLTLVDGRSHRFHVDLDERIARSLIEALGFVELPADGFDGDGIDALAELANLMAGAFDRVVANERARLRVSQDPADVVVEPGAALVDASTDRALQYAIELPTNALARLDVVLDAPALERLGDTEPEADARALG